MGIPVETAPAWLKGEGHTVRTVREMLRAIEEGDRLPPRLRTKGYGSWEFPMRIANRPAWATKFASMRGEVFRRVYTSREGTA